MDVGPIVPIRPVTTIKPVAAAPDLSRVFEVEYLGHSGDDEYSPAHPQPARGLEDEEEPGEQETELDSDSLFLRDSSPRVSLIA